MAHLAGHNIICIASAMWDQLWVNAQHVMSRLAQDNRVLYVESTGLRPPSRSRSDFNKVLLRAKNLFRGTRQISDNLFVVAPFTFPLYQSRLASRLNEYSLRLQILYLIRKLDLAEPILWNFYPTGESLVGHIGEKMVIYHCVDEYTEHPSVPKDAIRSMEVKLLAKTDLVFATNPVLYEDKKRFNSNIHYLPNVADVTHFQSALGDLNLPADLSSISVPRIGYVGNISNYKFNFELVAELAQGHPNWSFILIGPVGIGDPSTDISVLQRLPNIHFLGPRPFESLPAYLRGMDVCIVPFRDNKYNSTSFPLKFHEYLAAGKKIVTTPLPAFEEYKDIVSFATTVHEFGIAIEGALHTDISAELWKRRESITMANSWEKRMSNISELVEIELHRKYRVGG